MAAWQIPEIVMVGMAKLAHHIAEKIDALLGDPTQNITAGDILVLVRKRDASVPELSRALKRRQINVAGADRMVLPQQLAVADMLVALDIALNLSDDMAVAIFCAARWAALMKTRQFLWRMGANPHCLTRCAQRRKNR